jgi:hypothetical protein
MGAKADLVGAGEAGAVGSACLVLGAVTVCPSDSSTIVTSLPASDWELLAGLAALRARVDDDLAEAAGLAVLRAGVFSALDLVVVDFAGIKVP